MNGKNNATMRDLNPDRGSCGNPKCIICSDTADAFESSERFSSVNEIVGRLLAERERRAPEAGDSAIWRAQDKYCYGFEHAAMYNYDPYGYGGDSIPTPAPAPRPTKAGDTVEGVCKRCNAEKLILAKIDETLMIFCKLCGHKVRP